MGQIVQQEGTIVLGTPDLLPKLWEATRHMADSSSRNARKRRSVRKGRTRFERRADDEMHCCWGDALLGESEVEQEPYKPRGLKIMDKWVHKTYPQDHFCSSLLKNSLPIAERGRSQGLERNNDSQCIR